MPNLKSESAKPITPRPMRRVVLDIWSMAGSGYLLTSITLSRKRVDVWMVERKPSQSKLTPSSVLVPERMKRPRLIEPKLQES